MQSTLTPGVTDRPGNGGTGSCGDAQAAPVMVAVEQPGLIEDVLAILDRTPGLVVERVGYHVPVRRNADDSIGTRVRSGGRGRPKQKGGRAELSVR